MVVHSRRKWSSLVKFKIFTVLMILMMFFGLSCCVDWLVEASVSEKCAASIFRVEVMSRDSDRVCVCVCVCARVRGCVLCVCVYTHAHLQERKSEGQGQLGWLRQRLSCTNEETPRRHQKRGGWCRECRTDEKSPFQSPLDGDWFFSMWLSSHF
jgi:hypothetical protein